MGSAVFEYFPIKIAPMCFLIPKCIGYCDLENKLEIKYSLDEYFLPGDSINFF